MIMYKEKCGFMKIGCCTFKPEHCRPEEDGKGTGVYCDLYNIGFTLKSVKKEMNRLKNEIDNLPKENLQLSKVKVVDLSKGYEYLEKAYIHLKWSKQ